jgi:hypothetical protein
MFVHVVNIGFFQEKNIVCLILNIELVLLHST